MTSVPAPDLYRLTAVLEVSELDFGMAVAAGVGTEMLEAAGFEPGNPVWDKGGETAAGRMDPLTLGAGPAGRIDIAIRPADAGIDGEVAIPVLASMLQALHEEGAATEARLDRIGVDVFPLPRVPLFGEAHGLILSREAFADAYEDPDLAGRLTRVQYAVAHGRLMLLRGLSGARQDAYVRAIHDGQMALARGARPGLTAYGAGPWPDWAETAIRFGEPALAFAGVVDGVATWRCDGPPDRTARAWELVDMMRLAAAGQTPEGTPVSGLRVIFADRARAFVERRPLLDIGVAVLLDGSGDGDGGDLIPVTA